jgi:putative MFS transporter
MALGCLLAGPLADRYGRKRMFQFFLVWFTIWSGVCALAWSFASMAMLRFVLGIGLGGELPVGVTLISELLPRSGRRLLPVYQSFYGFGTIAAAAVSLLLVPAFPGGWRLVFLVGLLPVMYAVLLRRKLPESARWLAQKGRIQEAQLAVASLRDRSTSVDDRPQAGYAESAFAISAQICPTEEVAICARTRVQWNDPGQIQRHSVRVGKPVLVRGRPHPTV